MVLTRLMFFGDLELINNEDVIKIKGALQGFVFKNGRGALNFSPERFKESCQESNSYKHH